jgi:hypothetical protein
MRDLVQMVMNIQVPWKAVKFLISLLTGGFSRGLREDI